LEQCLGSVQSVLFEHKKNDHWIGHSDNYVTIKMRSEKDLRNKIIDVKILRLEGQTIIGVLKGRNERIKGRADGPTGKDSGSVALIE
jgi:hypothetical protein